MALQILWVGKWLPYSRSGAFLNTLPFSRSGPLLSAAPSTQWHSRGRCKDGKQNTARQRGIGRQLRQWQNISGFSGVLEHPAAWGEQVLRPDDMWQITGDGVPTARENYRIDPQRHRTLNERELQTVRQNETMGEQRGGQLLQRRPLQLGTSVWIQDKAIKTWSKSDSVVQVHPHRQP